MLITTDETDVISARFVCSTISCLAVQGHRTISEVQDRPNYLYCGNLITAAKI